MPYPNIEGRPTTYTDAVLLELPKYIDECARKKSLPKRVGFALFIGVAKATLWAWDKKFPQLHEALLMLDSIQEDIVLDGALYNKMNAVIAKLVLANHGYFDKQMVDSTNTNLNTDISQTDGKPIEERLQEVLQRIKELQSE